MNPIRDLCNKATADGNDIVRGGAGNDDIRTYGGSDTIYGGADHDIIALGRGGTHAKPQIAKGEAGNDRYIIDANMGRANIGYELANGGYDVIKFAGHKANELVLGRYENETYGTVVALTSTDSNNDLKLHIVHPENIERFEFADGTAARLSLGGTYIGLNGTSGNDKISTLNTNLTQHLHGSAGNDSYHYWRGDGNKAHIGVNNETATGGTDTFLFHDVNLAHMTLGNNGDLLRLNWTVDGKSGWAQFGDHGKNIETYGFSDGTRVASIAIRADGRSAFKGTQNNDKIHTTHGDDVIYGYGGDDNLYGRAGRDHIEGGDGNDTIGLGEGRTGAWQIARGGAGNDRYLIDSNNGWSAVENEEADGGYDVIEFRGINARDLSFAAHPTTAGAIILQSTDTKNDLNIHVNNANNIERFEFADGTAARLTLGATYIGLNGTSGNDKISTLNSDLSQHLHGSAGNDSYHYWRGDGNKAHIGVNNETATGGTDTFLFHDVNLGHMTLGHNADHLRLNWEMNGKTGWAQFGDYGQNIETYGFSDGTRVSSIAIRADGRSEFKGSNNKESILTTHGDDVIFGYGGDDILHGRNGNDHVNGGAGSDSFLFHKGDDEDVICDFTDNADTIELLGFADVFTFAKAKSLAKQNGADVIFNFGNSDILTVKNITVAALEDDLIFA